MPVAGGSRAVPGRTCANNDTGGPMTTLAAINLAGAARAVTKAPRQRALELMVRKLGEPQVS